MADDSASIFDLPAPVAMDMLRHVSKASLIGSGLASGVAPAVADAAPHPSGLPALSDAAKLAVHTFAVHNGLDIPDHISDLLGPRPDNLPQVDHAPMHLPGGESMQVAPEQSPSILQSGGTPAQVLGMRPTVQSSPTILDGPKSQIPTISAVAPPDKTADPNAPPIKIAGTPYEQTYRQILSRLDGLTTQQQQHLVDFLKSDDEQFKDPKTGKAYKMPEATGIEKMIGGKHSIGDIATIILALVAGLSGKQGQLFAGGLLQGAYGGKQDLAAEATQSGQRQFQYEQQARQQKAERALKILGMDDQQISQAMTQLGRLDSVMATDDYRKAQAEATKRDKGQASLNTALARFQGAKSFAEKKIAAQDYNKAIETYGLQGVSAITDDQSKAAFANGPEFDRTWKEYQQAIHQEMTDFGTVKPGREKALSNMRAGMLTRLGIDPNAPEADAFLPPPPDSMETLAAKRFEFLKGKDRQTLLQGWRRLKDYETAITNAKSLGESRVAVSRWVAENTAHNKYIDSIGADLFKEQDSSRKALDAFEKSVLPPRDDATQKAKDDYAARHDALVNKAGDAQGAYHSYTKNLTSPTIPGPVDWTTGTTSDIPNPLFKQNPKDAPLGIDKTGGAKALNGVKLTGPKLRDPESGGLYQKGPDGKWHLVE